MWKSSSLMMKPGNQSLEGGIALADPSVSFESEPFSKSSLMRMEMGISQLEKPMQLSCKNRLASADGAWQQEFFRLASSNFYNGYNPEDSGKINRWIMNVKEINSIEALRLSCIHGELTLTLVCCCPQKFCPDEEALGILDIGMRAAVSCTYHGDNGIKIHSFASDILHV